VTNVLPSDTDIVFQDKASRERGEHPDTPSPLTCPDCGGVLWELRQGDLVQYRCHVGHAYSEAGILSLQSDEVERALWAAARSLEEKAALSRRMAVNARAQNRLKSEQQFQQRAAEAEQNAMLVRQIITRDRQFEMPEN
jgi:two-component system chemotaxis response regulator CheB